MRTILVAFLIIAPILPAIGQDQAAPSYVASPIRRNADASNRSTGFRPGGFFMNGGTIRQIFQIAYPSQAQDPIGAPEWMLTERYDMTVRFDGTPTPEQNAAIFREIFADQLKLRAHYETRDAPTYTMVLARADGRLPPAVRRLEVDCDSLMAAARRGESVPALPPSASGAPACGDQFGNGSITSGGMRMDRLAGAIRNVAGRLIIDKTGLVGFYEFSLEWAPQRPPSSDAPADTRPNIFTAIQEQLGLKLEASTSPVQVVVIDHIERPSEGQR